MDPGAVMYDSTPGKVAGHGDDGADDDMNGATMQTIQNGEQSLHNEPTELDVSYQALDSFDKYATMAHMTVHRRRQNLYALPSSNFQILANPPFNLLDNMSAVDDAIDVNSRLSMAIVEATMSSQNFPLGKVSAADMPWNGFAKINDVSST
jgi:carnosine N-methyltransferase